MLPFFTLMNIVFVVLNFTLSKEVLDFSYCVAVLQVCVACFMAYLWGANS